MNKAIIYFEANEQCLTRTGTECFASDTISYIEADFNLGENWSGFDSVRAVWSNGWETVSTVLDSDGKAIVPTEVLTRRAKVRVNLVGSIANGNELTDRLTTFPIEALDITKKALIDGSETAPITPSQFEQFVANVKADADRSESARDEAESIKTEVEGLKSDVVQLKTDTEAIKTETESLVDGFDARVTEALDDISEAKTDALDGISSAKTNALTDIGSAKTQAVDDVTTEANTQKSAITQLGTAQKDAVTDEGARQIGLVTEEGTDQIESVQNEGQTQVNAVRTEGGTQITNIEQRGADVLSRIPYFAPIITDTAEGSIASFTDGADDYPMKSVVAEIVPKQAGSGDPSPTNVRPIEGWSGVEVQHDGKNLLDCSNAGSYLPTGATFETATQKFRYVTGSYGDICEIPLLKPIKKGQTYTMTMSCDGGVSSKGIIVGFKSVHNGPWLLYTTTQKEISLTGKVYTETATFNEDANYLVIFLDYPTTVSTEIVFSLQLELGSTATAYEPYTGQSHSISFPSTVYGGEVDVVKGLLKSYPFYPSYNGETLSGEWICDRAVYSQGTTPPIGSQVVDMSGNGTEYQLEPTEIKTLKGDNTIWSDGEVECEYCADTKLYIDKKINALI